MKRRMLLTLFALVLPLIAQQSSLYQTAPKEEKPAPAKGDIISKVFEVKYQDPMRLLELLGAFGAQLRPSPALKAIAVSGPAPVVDAVGEAISRFDVPVKNIELTMHILAGGAQAQSQDAIPKELEGVAKQLRNTFSFQGLRVLDTAVIRGRAGRNASASGAFSPPPGTTYEISLGSLSVSSGAKENVVRIDNLRLSARIPTSPERQVTGVQPMLPQSREAGFRTEIDVREGQRVVVGKANIDESGTALILVVTAKVVE